MKICVIIVAAMAGALASADDTASINLGGVKVQHATNQSRDSGSDTIDPARRYGYVVDGLVKGDSGLLAVFFPQPTPLADVIEFFQPGGAAALAGAVNNLNGTHPAVLLDTRFEGSNDIGSFAATFRVGIRATNVAYFELIDVVINPSWLIGSASFTSGSAMLMRVECPSDFNIDGFVTGDDFDLFVAAFEIGDLSADYNNDTFVTGDDFDGFVAAFEEGC